MTCSPKPRSPGFARSRYGVTAGEIPSTVGTLALEGGRLGLLAPVGVALGFQRRPVTHGLRLVVGRVRVGPGRLIAHRWSTPRSPVSVLPRWTCPRSVGR